jgi:ketosteroid isomerase-like protein
VEHGRVTGWIEAYERAWRTPGTDGLAELFTEDASYRTGPYEKPHRGLAEIGRMWEAERASANEEFEMTTEIVATEGEVAVIRVEVRYASPKREYRDLWIVRLEESGRCSHFEEWPFWPEDQQGAPAAGPAG